MDLRLTGVASKLVHVGAVLAGSDRIWRAPDQIWFIRGSVCLTRAGGITRGEACFPDECEREVREKRCKHREFWTSRVSWASRERQASRSGRSPNLRRSPSWGELCLWPGHCRGRSGRSPNLRRVFVDRAARFEPQQVGQAEAQTAQHARLEELTPPDAVAIFSAMNPFEIKVLRSKMVAGR
jgi:hypothetical protein